MRGGKNVETTNTESEETRRYYQGGEKLIMRKGGILLLGAILISVLMALPVISGCAPEVAPQPEEKVATYLSLYDYTGPLGGICVSADMGVEDYCKDLNERGGVDGVKINMIGVDTRYDVARGVSAYKRYRTEPNLLLVNSCSTALGKAIGPMIAKDKVVTLTPADGEFQAHIGWVFCYGVTYQNAFGASIDWMVEDWKTRGNAGMPTVGYMGWDNPAGREPLRGGREYAEQVGVKLLEPEFFPTGCLDHSIFLTRIAEAGADYCYIGGVVDPTPSLVLRDAHKLGLTETIQFVNHIIGGPAESVGIKLHPEATEGAVICEFYLRGDEATSHPLGALAEKYRGKKASEIGAHYVLGMTFTLVYEAGLKKALDAASYDKLDGEAMLHAYESLTGMDVTQGLMGPCAYSPTSRQGCDIVKFYEVRSGKVVPITDWRKVPDCVSLYDWGE